MSHWVQIRRNVDLRMLGHDDRFRHRDLLNSFRVQDAKGYLRNCHFLSKLN